MRSPDDRPTARATRRLVAAREAAHVRVLTDALAHPERASRPRARRRPIVPAVVWKTCADCGQRLPTTAFRRSAADPDGYFRTCKTCRQIAAA
jgi:hypothetical protein